MSLYEIVVVAVAIIGIILLLIEFFILVRKKRKVVVIEDPANDLYRKSFAAKLNLTTDENKDLYSKVKNKLLSYDNVTSSVAWNNETYTMGRTTLAKVNVRKEIVLIYLPLELTSIDLKRYTPYDCSNVEKYKLTPLRFKVRNNVELTKAFELIDKVMTNNSINVNPSYEEVVFYEKNRGFDQLYDEGLIRTVEHSSREQLLVEWLEEHGWTLKKIK